MGGCQRGSATQLEYHLINGGDMNQQNTSISFGVVGLGRIGGGLAGQALDKGFQVMGYDKAEPSPELINKGLDYCSELNKLCYKIDQQKKIVFIYVPAGSLVDEIADEIASQMQAGDIIVDGGNSYWGDSLKRHRRYAQRGIEFVDLGTSGGISGATTGACFMAGGNLVAVKALQPILESLATKGGYVHAGSAGAGHFVKLVHNGIEFGMLQAIGEGMSLLAEMAKHSTIQEIKVSETLECWRHGSVIRSWLVDLLAASLPHESLLEDVPSYIEDTGEVNWLLEDALRLEVPIPVINSSVQELFSSRRKVRIDHQSVALMRKGFGGHPLGSDPAIQDERKTSRVFPPEKI